MSIFTNSKKNLLIAILLLLNIVTISMVWFGFGGRPPRGRRPVNRFLMKELGLNSNQIAQFEKLQQKHKERVRPLFKATNDSRRKILETITTAEPDTLLAKEIAGSLGVQESKLQLELIEHYMALRAVCDKEQQEKLRRIFRETAPKPPRRPPEHGPGK